MTPPDLILITWNRHHYLSKMLPNLLADPADFRLYWWDNASTDGTAQLVRETDDPRIVEKHIHEENVGQIPACHWFFDKAQSDVVGKIDDDILLPHGWTEQLSSIARSDERIGMVGCWIFMEKDWLPRKTHINTVRVGEVDILQMTAVAGHSFLCRTELMRRYTLEKVRHGLPIARGRMTREGYISGVPLPPLFAHNMDDPRSPHCKTHNEAGQLSALTARKLGFKTVQEYADWIAADARDRQRLSIARQLRRRSLLARRDRWGRLQRRLLKLTGLW